MAIGDSAWGAAEASGAQDAREVGNEVVGKSGQARGSSATVAGWLAGSACLGSGSGRHRLTAITTATRPTANNTGSDSKWCALW